MGFVIKRKKRDEISYFYLVYKYRSENGKMREKHIAYLGKEKPTLSADALRHEHHEKVHEALGSIEDATELGEFTIQEAIKDSGMF